MMAFCERPRSLAQRKSCAECIQSGIAGPLTAVVRGRDHSPNTPLGSWLWRIMDRSVPSLSSLWFEPEQ